MRDFLFAIIPHKAYVNLQLADGVDLPNRDGRIEGTGKRIRHVKVRSRRRRRRAVACAPSSMPSSPMRMLADRPETDRV